MILADLTPAEAARRLAAGDVSLQIGPFSVRLTSPVPSFVAALYGLYRDHPIETGAGFDDFHVWLEWPRWHRRWFRPKVEFLLDGYAPFKPLPESHAPAGFEWGLNWCIANQAHEYLLVHSAVVARGARALVLPGSPGSGKSTLCAALVSRGWRLFSDEMAIFDHAGATLVAMPRPISLKNQSIAVMRRFARDAYFGPIAPDTAKGDVGHMRPPAESTRLAADGARAAWIVFPKYAAGEPTTLVPVSKGRAFMRLAENSFNYHLLGRTGFDLFADVIDAADAYDLRFSDLEDATAQLAKLAA